MTAGDAASQLREEGVAVLPGILATALVLQLRLAAERCFAAARTPGPFAEQYKFNRYSHSMLLAALADCELAGPEVALDDLLEPLSAPELAALVSDAVGPRWTCRMEHSWVRKKFAPSREPGGGYCAQGWHQDGALGVRFPAEVETASRDERGYWVATTPLTELMTCWVPLEACGREAPGLEFVRGSQAGLLHFTELGDADIRRRFGAERLWAPELGVGDAVVFLNSVLHRTYVRPGMTRDRMSVEYRVFPL